MSANVRDVRVIVAEQQDPVRRPVVRHVAARKLCECREEVDDREHRVGELWLNPLGPADHGGPLT